jgi:O-antigen/teichoic acid export membrane protein
MTGTTIAQAIPIAISPILTRIYSPADFGIFALYMSIAGLFSAVATGRYELAIMHPKKDEDAINLVVLSVTIAFFISLVVLLIIFLFNQQITELLGNTEISKWLYVIPLTVLLTGVYQSFNYWSNRKKQYKRLATSRVIQSVTVGSTNLGMGFNGFGTSGLVVGSVVGQSIATLVLMKMVWKEDNKLLDYVNKLKIFALIKKHKKLPLLNLPNALIDSFRLSGISMLIAKFFSTATLGQFSLAWKIIQTPTSLIGGSLSQVFFQKVANANKVDLNTIVNKFIVKAALIAAPIFLIIYIFSVDIFIFIFGANWELAGEAASVMAPWLFLNFVSSPLSLLFIVLNKQEILLIFSILFMAIPLAIIIIFQSSSFIEVLLMVTFSVSIMIIIFILMVIYYTKHEKGLLTFTS